MATVVEQQELNEKLRLVRSERYACQSVARLILPSERVSKCLRSVLNNTQVEVWKHLKTDKAFYNGLLVCGSVWTCPVCAAKISERRRQELNKAFELHRTDKKHIALLTLTFSHKKTDKLKETLKKFSSAMIKFRSGKRYQKIREKMGLIGTVRAFEITYGSNGFHPHAHLALFYTNDINLDLMKYEMFDLWKKACNKFGLTTLQGVGLDLQNGSEADEYLSKYGTWGLDKELSKSHVKKGKKGSMTPFDFLREIYNSGDTIYFALFKEYAEALKGKRQLQWSPGLKSHFLIGEKTDEEVAKETIEQADLLGLIDYQTWKFILKYEKRTLLLDYIEKYGFEIALHKVKKEPFFSKGSWEKEM